MYDYEISPNLQKIMKKLFKKNKQLRERIISKIDEIINSFNVENYKNLKHRMKDIKRVHIGEKVLVFKYLKKEKKIIFVDFDHHDKIYKKWKIKTKSL